MRNECRFVSVGDSPNFRHLGGYPTRDGRSTKPGRLFRGGWFELKTPDDLARFEACAIRQIFDFRTDAERARQPLLISSATPPETTQLSIASGSMKPYVDSLATKNATEIDCKSAMTRMYYEMLDAAKPQFRSFLQSAHGKPPIMMMCSTGKDRTGVASALLLTALGVPKPVVFEDYLISASVYRGREEDFARRHGYDARGIDVGLVRDIFTVHPDYLDAVWRRAEEVSGSMERYITDHLIDKRDLDRLREEFTA